MPALAVLNAEVAEGSVNAPLLNFTKVSFLNSPLRVDSLIAVNKM